MKLAAVVLSVILSYVQGLSNDQVVCSATSLQFTGSQADFPRYESSQLKLGTCTLGDDFSLDADFEECNLRVFSGYDTITYVAPLIGDNPSGIITRRKPVFFTISCTYNTKTQKTAGASVSPNLPAITGDLTQSGSAIDLHLNLLDGEGNVVASGQSLSVKVGSTVSAEIGGANLAALQLRAYATNCFVTASDNADDTNRWDLLINSCPADETFLIEDSGFGQKMLFESFAFTYDDSKELYLHCDLAACQADAGCGQCSTTARRRRSLKVTKEVSARISIEF